MKRLLLGSLITAACVFLWGFVFWAILASVDEISSDDELAMQSALAQHVPETGTYVIPSARGDGAEYTRRHEAGPVAMIFVRKEGSSPMSFGTFLGGFIHELIFAVLVGLLLRMTWAALPTYRARLSMVLLAGVAAAFWYDFADPIWWAHPWAFHLQNFVYSVGAWAIAGAIMSRFADPSRVVPAETAPLAPATMT